ncbi:hypothetical protein BGW80DRAFT_1320247, partial [Lactifluus volemus]
PGSLSAAPRRCGASRLLVSCRHGDLLMIKRRSLYSIYWLSFGPIKSVLLVQRPCGYIHL